MIKLVVLSSLVEMIVQQDMYFFRQSKIANMKSIFMSNKSIEETHRRKANPYKLLPYSGNNTRGKKPKHCIELKIK